MKYYLIIINLIFICNLILAEASPGISTAKVIEVLESNPDNLTKEAWQAYQQEDYKEAIKFYQQFIYHNSSESNAIYNLACCYGSLENAELAAKFLDYAYDTGFRDFPHIKQDIDFKAVKDKAVFQQTLNKIEKKWSESNNNQTETVYLENKVFQKGLISLPPHYSRKQSYYLVMALHGYSSNANNFLKLCNSSKRDSLIFAVPFAPYPFSVGKDIGYSWNLWTEDEEISKNSALASQNYILNFIEYMKNNYNISEVYLFGFSQGAFFSFDMILQHFDQIDGIIPFGGGFHTLPSKEEVAKIPRDIRLFVAHGKKDKVVEFRKSKKSVELLNDNGLKVKFVEFDGAHHVPIPILQQAFDWIHK